MIEDKDYKKLLGISSLVSFIFDLRFYRETIPNDLSIQKKLDFIDNSVGIPERIEMMITLADNGQLDLSRSNYIDISILAETLETKYPSRREDIKQIVFQTKTFLKRCPKIEPLAIELIEFSKALKLDSKYEATINGKIERLLEKLNFKNAKKEREYLMTKCSYPQWYYSFFFKNRSNRKKRYDIDFNELIESVFEYGDLNRGWLLSTIIKVYLDRGLASTLKKRSLKKLLTGSFSQKRILSGEYILYILKDSIEESALETVLLEVFEDYENVAYEDITPTEIICLFRRTCMISSEDRALSLFSKVIVSRSKAGLYFSALRKFLDEKDYNTLKDLTKLQQKRIALLKVLRQAEKSITKS